MPLTSHLTTYQHAAPKAPTVTRACAVARHAKCKGVAIYPIGEAPFPACTCRCHA